MVRRVLFVFVFVVLAALLSTVAFAQSDGDQLIDYDMPVVNCDGASITFRVPPWSSYDWTLEVDGQFVNGGSGFNQSDQLIEVTGSNVGAQVDPFPFTEGDHNATFFLGMGQQPGRGGLPISTDFSCPDDDDDETPSLAPGRACFGPGEVAAAVYVTGSSVEVWTIANDLGELAIQIGKDELYDHYTPGTPVKVAETDVNIHVELWVQANGFIRVLAGPDAEGKLFECVFGGRYSRVRSYFPGQVGPDELVPDEPEPTPTPTPEIEVETAL